MNSIVVGTQWGDEGKGKIIDVLSSQSDIVVRYQGGNNAGHTVYHGPRKYVMHLVPSGILEKGVQCVIANGVVIEPEALLGEIRMLEKGGIRVRGRLWVSEQAHLIFPYHKIYDRLREENKGFIKIGTTGKGIGPCYSDRALRSGIRMVDLYDRELFRSRLELSLREKNEIFRKLYGFKGFEFKKLFKDYLAYAEALKPYVRDVNTYLDESMRRKKRILYEGAQGTLLDLDQGTYPFVTSSFTTAGGACVGSLLPPNRVNRIIGVAKAYTTRVGEGPFPTEFGPILMEEIRKRGNEFGATTGRPRRCGWFDAVVVRHAVRTNGLTELVLTKLDVLDEYPSLRIAIAYRWKGKRLDHFPASIRQQREVKPVYIDVPGWAQSTSAVRQMKKLPVNARRYIATLERLVGVRVSMVSVGSDREQTIRVSSS